MAQVSTDKPSVKESNPKDILGSDKLPLHLWPQTATAFGCMALMDGALKYGRNNYRAIGVRSTIYYDAAMRHLTSWFEGQDLDPDSGLPHLAHALACLAILVDAQSCGQLNDDRQYPGGWDKVKADLTPEVARLKAKYQDRGPQHYTIQETAHHAWNRPDPVLVKEYEQPKSDLLKLLREQCEPLVITPEQPIDKFVAQTAATTPDAVTEKEHRLLTEVAIAPTVDTTWLSQDNTPLRQRLTKERAQLREDLSHEDAEGDPEYWGV